MHDAAEIRRALAILATLPGVVEIRAPKARLNGSRPGTAAGYFDNHDAAAQAAAKLSGNAPGVYITLNPVNAALLARAANRVDPRAERTTGDAEITARRWLLLDFDPDRPAGISSNDTEHAAALDRAAATRAWLDSQGWPAPVYADSGNGAHLLYRIDLPNDATNRDLLEAVLKALAARFDDDLVKIDTGVFNASRISKIYGTTARKGDPLPDRPHRIARILEAPETPVPVDSELLRALIPAPAPTAQPFRASRPTVGRSSDFFAQVNDRAMSSLAAWVPALLPAAVPHHDGYRVRSAALGRDLEEDLSIIPTGIVDFGLRDQGDPQDGKRTPIDLVIEHGREADAKDAALWLCQQLGLDPTTLGWNAPRASASDRGTDFATRGHARPRTTEYLDNPSHPSSSSQSITYPFITETQPFIFITINKLDLRDPKGELPAESVAAAMLAEELRGKLAFSNEALTWHVFTGTHWHPVGAKPVDDFITAVLYDAAPDGFDLKYLRAIQKLLGSGLLPLCSPADAPGAKIPFKNGILDTATMELARVTPDNALTWSLPYDYEPGAACPTITRWLADAVDGDEQTLEFLKAWLQAVLVGRPDLQKFLHLLGPGGTGKGTFIRLTTKLVGERNRTITDLRNLETNRFETAGLYQKRLVAITDSGNYRGGVDVLKALTGQDPIRLERKHQQQSGTFTFGGMVILASNEGLETTDLTSGIERRRLTVEFNNVATAEARAAWDAQGGEEAVLHREIPGLVNWVLSLSREEVTARIMRPPPRAVLSNLDALRFQNPIADWLLENTEPDQEADPVKVGVKQPLPVGGFFHADDWLYPNYLDWYARTGRKGSAVSLVRFSRLIVDIARMFGVNLNKNRAANGVFIRGLRLLKKDPITGDLLTLHKNSETVKGCEGLGSGKWLKMMNVKDVRGCSNLNTSCARAAARSNNRANEDSEEFF